ncbi:fructose 1,6-bisphosphatase [Aquimarina sp. 2201CG5-10]|uniref:fructose 1,6-bisphosphatase n=1 Tax=Aquimarina callyspongiae TaxID=3098150 RepID=UPI002AB3B8DE|nr:fructose 1,6-bisphosphatase [Aquimarina sp. 2201CG5-10]MDY8136966.1 fructose 1,6-bisphosphatase [Aquimarina sp. 2201CG5-10]
MAKEKKAEEQQTSNDPSSKIEAIKNLIFGENIEAYNSEFEKVKKDIASKKRELEDFIDETRISLNQSIDNLSTDVNIRITELEDNLADKAEELDAKKVDKKTLGDLLIAMGEKINQK